MRVDDKINFYFQLKDLSIYVKNLILFKSKQAGADRAHIKSFHSILERRINGIEALECFFKGSESIVQQILRYLETSGEIVNMKNGYYMVLLPRNILLPKSRQIITIGGLSSNDINIENLRIMHTDYQDSLVPINLNDYRFDYDLETWLKIFRQSKEPVFLKDSIFKKPTKYRLQEVTAAEIKDKKLYYCISNPIANKKDYYVAYKVNEAWYGTYINNNIIKSIFTLMNNAGYTPTYSIKKIKNCDSLYEIRLSNILPDVENDQVLLFSMPEVFKRAKKYYVAKNFLQDFIYVLDKLNFRKER